MKVTIFLPHFFKIFSEPLKASAGINTSREKTDKSFIYKELYYFSKGQISAQNC